MKDPWLFSIWFLCHILILEISRFVGNMDRTTDKRTFPPGALRVSCSIPGIKSAPEQTELKIKGVSYGVFDIRR